MKKNIERIISEPMDILYIVSTFEGYPQQENNGQLEELDLEEFGILEVTDTKLRFWAGGGWQTPMEVTLELIDDKFVFTEAKRVDEYGFFERMLVEQLPEEKVYELLGLQML
jgi:hypothetical protein